LQSLIIELRTLAENAGPRDESKTMERTAAWISARHAAGAQISILTCPARLWASRQARVRSAAARLG
jgi:hypothetical protein